MIFSEQSASFVRSHSQAKELAYLFMSLSITTIPVEGEDETQHVSLCYISTKSVTFF